MKLSDRIKNFFRKIQFRDVVAFVILLVVVLIIASIIISGVINRDQSNQPDTQPQTVDEAIEQLLEQKSPDEITVEDIEKLQNDYGVTIVPPGKTLREWAFEQGLPSADQLFQGINELGESDPQIEGLP